MALRDASVREIDFVEVGGRAAADPLGPGDVPNRTYDVVPHAQGIDYDDSGWEALAPADTHAPPLAGTRVLQLVPHPR